VPLEEARREMRFRIFLNTHVRAEVSAPEVHFDSVRQVLARLAFGNRKGQSCVLNTLGKSQQFTHGMGARGLKVCGGS